MLKTNYGADSDLHGTRLDVYVEPVIEEGSLERATVYDMEPDCTGFCCDAL